MNAESLGKGADFGIRTILLHAGKWSVWREKGENKIR